MQCEHLSFGQPWLVRYASGSCFVVIWLIIREYGYMSFDIACMLIAGPDPGC